MERFANLTREQIATFGPSIEWDRATPQQRERWLHDSGFQPDPDQTVRLWADLPEHFRLTLRQQVMGERGHMPLSRFDQGRDHRISTKEQHSD